MKHFMFETPEAIQEHAKTRHEEEQARKEAMELVVSYAKDIVDFWPNMTLRTIRIMSGKMAGLKEALSLLK